MHHIIGRNSTEVLEKYKKMAKKQCGGTRQKNTTTNGGGDEGRYYILKGFAKEGVKLIKKW